MTNDTKNKKAVIYVTGMQFGESYADGDEKIETITPGTFRKIGDYYYIKYEEMQEGFTEKTDVLLKVKPGVLEITKKGLVHVHMLISANETHQTNYKTPFGNLIFTIHGEKVTISEDTSGLHIYAKYGMDVNYEHLSVNELKVEVKAE